VGSNAQELTGCYLLRVARLSILAFLWSIAELLVSTAIIFIPEQMTAQTTPSAIVVGFVGGFVHVDDIRHGEVKMVEQLRATYGDRVRVQLFKNRDKTKAHESILRWLDSNSDGSLSGDEGHHMPIILFGNSWGASVVISLARELKAEAIPVLLTVQVDSIRRLVANDSIIPANVAEAVNYYQNSGMLRGCKKITAEDESRTKILGNFHLQYSKEPAESRQYPWYGRLLTKGHIEIDSDPLVWAEVRSLIQAHLSSTSLAH
jgi:pimeloyl-ACP methyl ester carboxylesterase